MTCGASAMRSTGLEDPESWNLTGTDLNVTVAVLYLSASADAADGPNDHPSTFCRPPTTSPPSWAKLSRVWRNWSSVMRLGILEILKASPVAPAVVPVVSLVAGILSRFWRSLSSLEVRSFVLRLDIVLTTRQKERSVEGFYVATWPRARVISRVGL